MDGWVRGSGRPGMRKIEIKDNQTWLLSCPKQLEPTRVSASSLVLVKTMVCPPVPLVRMRSSQYEVMASMRFIMRGRRI
jgi:hypothetical protein